MRKLLVAVGLLLATSAAAQWNNWQQFPPANRNYITVRHACSPPEAASSLVATAVSDTEIDLTWTDNSSDETSFVIERCSGASCSNFVAVHTESSGTTSKADTGLTANTSYSYRVLATKDCQDGDYSNTATAVTCLTAFGAYPGCAGIIFANDYTDGNATPEKGTAGTLTRATTENYYDALTTMAQASSGNPAGEAFPFNGAGTQGGVFHSHPAKNWILRSEELDNASWTAVVTGTVTANDANSPKGTATAEKLAAILGDDGIEQDSGITAVSKKFTFSAFVKRAGGADVAGKIVLAGTGGTPETTTAAFTATTGWKRVYVYKSFSGSATGNVTPKVTIDTALAEIDVWGAHLEQHDVGTFDSDKQAPQTYVATTSAVATQNGDAYSFAGSELTGLAQTYTVCMWINTLWDPNETSNFLGGIWTAMGTGPRVVLNWTGATRQILAYQNTSNNARATANIGSWTSNVWHHVCTTMADSSSYPVIYKEGADVTTSTTGTPGVFGWTEFRPGQGGAGSNFLDGIVSRIRIWNVALSAGNISTVYNAEKADFGL